MAGLGGAGPLACRDFPGSFITKTTCLPGRAIGEIRFLPGALRDSRAREIGPGDSSNFCDTFFSFWIPAFIASEAPWRLWISFTIFELNWIRLD
jgi:hypothetical protein